MITKLASVIYITLRKKELGGGVRGRERIREERKRVEALILQEPVVLNQRGWCGGWVLAK